jgi:urease accessory protein
LKRLAALLIFSASAAEAHGTLPGGGGFYSGALHPLVALEHFLVLLAAGLALGRDGYRRPLWALAVGLGAGLWLGEAGLSVLLLVLTLGLGSVLVLQWRAPEWVHWVALLAIGLAVGLDTDVPQTAPLLAALGVAVTVFLITLNAFALGHALAGSRAALVLRVAGAWMLAAALMVLALSLRVLA